MGIFAQSLEKIQRIRLVPPNFVRVSNFLISLLARVPERNTWPGSLAAVNLSRFFRKVILRHETGMELRIHSPSLRH